MMMYKLVQELVYIETILLEGTTETAYWWMTRSKIQTEFISILIQMAH